MIETKQINEIVQRLLNSLPPGLRELPRDAEKNFHQILQSTFAKMDLVTREEFDVQSKVLARTREKLEALEKKIRELEVE